MKTFALALGVLTFIIAACHAGESRDEIWQPTTPGPFVVYTAPLCRQNELDIQPLYFFNITRGSFNEIGGYKSLSSKDYKYQQLIQLFMQYGITDCFEIDCQPSWQFNYARAGGLSAESAGFGDIQLLARFCFLDETKWLPRATGIFQAKLPTGKYEKADEGKLDTDITGTGSTDYNYGISLTKGIEPMRLLLHADFLYANIPLPARVDGVKTEFSGIFILNSAFEWIFYKNFNLMGELLWQTQGDRREDGDWAPSTEQSSLIASTGLGYSEKSWQLLIGYQRTVWGENVDANDTVAATMIFIF